MGLGLSWWTSWTSSSGELRVESGLGIKVMERAPPGDPSIELWLYDFAGVQQSVDMRRIRSPEAA
jgi:hypothetical protein